MTLFPYFLRQCSPDSFYFPALPFPSSSTGVSSKVIELETHIETLSSLLMMLQNNNESLIAMNMFVTAYDIATTRESKHIVHQPSFS